MKTIKILFVFLFIIFYFSVNYFSLFLEFFIDKKLDNGDSIRTLAKDITNNASCDLDVIGSLIETSNGDTMHSFWCAHNRKNVHFLFIYLQPKQKKINF